MEIRLLHGAAIAPYIDDLARLRLTVFREFPYLYDGTPEYEADYLANYARSGRSLVVLALDDGKVVGVGVPGFVQLDGVLAGCQADHIGSALSQNDISLSELSCSSRSRQA